MRKKRHDALVAQGAYPRLMADRIDTAGLSRISDVSVPVQEVLVEASPNNAAIASVGPIGHVVIELNAGAAITIPTDDLNHLWVNLAQDDYINWIAVAI